MRRKDHFICSIYFIFLVFFNLFDLYLISVSMIFVYLFFGDAEGESRASVSTLRDLSLSEGFLGLPRDYFL